MAEDRWYKLAVPILEAVHGLEGSGLIRIGDLADQLGVEPMQVAVECERLIEAGYLSGKFGKVMSGGDARPWYVSNPAVTGLGARVVGVWPSENPYEALLALLDRRVAESSDEETRSRWRRLRESIAALGRDVGTNFVASLLVELGRGGIR